MRIYRIELTVSGNNDNPETREERIVAADWKNVLEIMAEICRDTGLVVLAIKSEVTKDRPFDYKSITTKH